MLRHRMRTRLFLYALLPLAASATLQATDQAPSPGFIPMTSPWDANEWESGSGASFWRAKEAKIPESTGTVMAVPVAPAATEDKGAQGGVSKPKYFSDRRTEK